MGKLSKKSKAIIQAPDLNLPVDSELGGKTPKPTIKQLEAILKNEEETPITIMPNGEIRTMTPEEISAFKESKSKCKPLTYKEDLGGEYAA